MVASPKPSLPFIAVSLLVILACLLLISAALAVLVVKWSAFPLVGGAFLLPLPCALAIHQYLATFRRVQTAAKFSATLLFITSALAALAFVLTVGELVARIGDMPRIGLLLPSGSIAFIGAIAGSLNLRWARKLSDATETSSRIRFSIRELLTGVAAVSVMTATTSSFVRTPPPKYAEHVRITDAPFGLPASAKDISFCQGLRGSIAYEFAVDELSFRQWVASGIGSTESKSAGIPPLPITAPVSITRYNAYSADLTGPDSITVAKGLHYSWSYDDRGVYVVFDSATNRVYYCAQFH